MVLSLMEQRKVGKMSIIVFTNCTLAAYILLRLCRLLYKYKYTKFCGLGIYFLVNTSPKSV